MMRAKHLIELLQMQNKIINNSPEEITSSHNVHCDSTTSKQAHESISLSVDINRDSSLSTSSPSSSAADDSAKDADYQSAEVSTSSSFSDSGGDIEPEMSDKPHRKVPHVTKNPHTPPKNLVRKRKRDPQQYQTASKKLCCFNSAQTYHFMVNENKIRFCEQFFMVTSGIDSRIVQMVVKKQEGSVMYIIEPKKHGKHGNHATVPHDKKEDVRDYIRVKLTTCKLHDVCNNFKEEVDISLHVLKKDLCGFCECFRNAKEEENVTLQEQYNKHIEEKELCRLEKESVKRCSDKVHAAKRFKRASPIYVPDNYVTIIKQAKKHGKIFDIHKMCYTNVFDMKHLAEDLGAKNVFSN
ncbi:hypothetical protein PR048_010966 [Dryococelus australis]|uniref:Uncharacterized protein n=1 Tax=Dryococelus australis TaxID=614101 RepID=A0ABQ9HKR5_9NEOP|nr:hypothetical protein PR048_010966 [Dryococelus australis]